MYVRVIAIALVAGLFFIYGLNWFVVGGIIGVIQGLWMNTRYPHRWPFHSMGMLILAGVAVNGTLIWLFAWLLAKSYTAIFG